MHADDSILKHSRVREASPCDVPTLLEIKRALAIEVSSGTPSRGGFLLGSSPELYLALASAGQILVVETGDESFMHGFGIAMEFELLRSSELWARRALIDWTPGFDHHAVMEGRIGYFDQLAIRPSAQRQRLGALLASSIMERLIATRHDMVMTTTLLEPIENTASLALIQRISGQRVGTIAEHYEGVGEVKSAIHLLPPQGFLAMRDHTLVHGTPSERHVLELASAAFA